ncbi:hypothetical protein E3T46_17580 [Cryobacterium sp. Hh11]|uniref:hypothetical protein n=1 Tax=Cryobacterium sp. Hh11 TaxID=2555868 RepID=UPI001069A1FC|nr:hypothetical protein [Cryobacterium sp. Hh11]TFD47603.1 hypothetical protein E3T46_17580 [Cryobacterium sp. Hh11]
MTAPTVDHLLHQSADRLDTAKHANSDHAAQAQAAIAQVLATQALVAATQALVAATQAQTEQMERLGNLFAGIMGDCTIRVERVS